MSDLIERINEIEDWHNTGILPGEALRDFARKTFSHITNDMGERLTMSEKKTLREAGQKYIEATAEITRLTEALAASEEDCNRLRSVIDVAENKLRLESALTDGAHRRAREAEEARRAERAAVVREIVERNDIISKIWSHYGDFKRAQAAILALATDADNAALDKLLREARMEGMERAALAVTERADRENEFAAIHGELENNSKAREAARVVTTLRGVAAHIRILDALEAQQ